MRTKNNNLIREHINIINRVIDYIDQNVDGELSLERVATVVAVSPSYLHRMFTKVTGDKLHSYILRTRLQKAVHYLVFFPLLTITEIAYECSFSSLSDFSRVFKKVTGSNPESFRTHYPIINRKICQIEDKEWESYFVQNLYNKDQSDRKATHQLRVSIREFPNKNIYYIRHFGKRNYAKLESDVQDSFMTLSNMTTRNGLWSSGTYLLGIPKFSLFTLPFLDFGYDACITTPRKVEVAEEIGMRNLQGGRYAVLRFEEAEQLMESFVHCLLHCWLPNSGYTYDYRPAMFISYNDPSSHPERKWIVDICLPIK
ncbi:AraC family transcriptional regulator [Paenibacillus sp. GSMTC-2017]|uniref:AraC family transcriptional regulator n=1 Tax=Paenibacillus sp. GSMTC-2017 TaxID=2794350 RepID=UPI0018D91A0B|nr:helix-turn-helix domain-containing protein [Paenibacillus sp. GSMTC-2017]MBH5318441.1 AraC family transcriptional regulator [Paenibacillus sp. GSMTC-2017]